MKRLLVGALALLLSCVAFPAQADSTRGSVAGINGVLYDDCGDYPYQYAVNVPAEAGYRDLVVSLFGPDGQQADTDRVAPATNQATGVSTVTLCRPTNSFGTYTIRATVRWGAEGSPPDQSSQLDDAHFAMRKPFSRTSLAASTRRPRYRQLVSYRIRAEDERPGGYAATAFTWVHLEKRVAGRWVRIKGGRAMTHDTGQVTVRLRYLRHHQRMRVRAVTETTSRYTRSVSPTVRVW